MPINFPGPYQIRLFYQATLSTVVFPHVCALNFDVSVAPDVGDPADDIVVLVPGGTSTLGAVITELGTVLAPFFNTTDVTFGQYEVWRYEEASFDAVFIAAASSGIDATSVTATVVDSQTIFSWRTSLGGIMKLDLRHTTQPQSPTIKYPAAGGAINDLFDFISGDNSPFVARDGSRPIAPLNFLAGLNEKMTRERLR